MCFAHKGGIIKGTSVSSFDNSTYTQRPPTVQLLVKKIQKGRGSALCVGLPLQSTKESISIDIARQKQQFMYAYMCIDRVAGQRIPQH